MQRIGSLTGSSEVRVSSTYRSPQRQIDVMYSQTISQGKDAQFKLYGEKGRQVVQAQVDATKAKGATEESIKNSMTTKANEVGFVSPHSSSNYENKNAIDIPRSDFSKEQIETIKSGYKNLDPNVVLIDEPDRNCLHFEIPTQQVTYSGGTMESVTVTAQGSGYLTPKSAVVTTSKPEEKIKTN